MKVNINKLSSIAFLSACLYSLGMVSSIAFYGKVDGGFFKYFLMLAASISVSYYAKKIYSRKLNKSQFLLFFLIFTMLFSVVMQVVFFDNLQEIGGEARYAHGYLISITLIAITWLLVGFAAGLSLDYEKSNLISLGIVFILYLFVIPLLDKSFVIDYRMIGDNVSHLSAGDGFYILIIAAVAFAREKIYWVIVVLSVILLFMLAGRANLAIFIITIAIYEFYKSDRKIKFFYLAITPVVLILIFNFIQFLSERLSGKGLAWKMLFSHGLENDGSFKGRNELFIKGMYSLKETFLIGDISSLISISGSVGSYIHNFLSWIQFYGFFSFLILILFVLFAISRLRVDFTLIKNSIRDKHIDVIFRVLMLLSGLVGVLLAKNGVYSILMFALGIYTGTTYKKQATNVKKYSSS